MVTGQKPLDNKPSRIIEEIIAKYVIDAYLFRLGSTNPKKMNPARFFLGPFIPGAFDVEPGLQVECNQYKQGG